MVNWQEVKLSQSMQRLEALRKKEFVYNNLTVEEREDLYELMKIEKIIIKLDSAKTEYKHALLKANAYSAKRKNLPGTATESRD